MFEEKKLKEYAECKLSERVNAADSLSRLKETQRATSEYSEAKRKKSSLHKKMVWSLSAALVVLVVVAGFSIRSLTSGFFASEKMTVDQTSFESPNGVAPNMTNGEESQSFAGLDPSGIIVKNDSESDSVVEVNYYAELNMNTAYVAFDLPQDCIVGNYADEISTYYAFALLSEIEIRAIVRIGIDSKAGLVFDFDREATVGGQRFSYTYQDDVLRGAIVTDREIISITRCVGESEEDCLLAIRSIILKK